MWIQDLKKCRQFISRDGAILHELLHPDKQPLSLRYSLAHARLAASHKTKPHALTTSEVYYILEGTGLMHIDQETQEVFPGYAVYIPPHSCQYIENHGNSDLVFLCIVDPAWRIEDEKIFTEKHLTE